MKTITSWMFILGFAVRMVYQIGDATKKYADSMRKNIQLPVVPIVKRGHVHIVLATWMVYSSLYPNCFFPKRTCRSALHDIHRGTIYSSHGQLSCRTASHSMNPAGIKHFPPRSLDSISKSLAWSSLFFICSSWQRLIAK